MTLSDQSFWFSILANSIYNYRGDYYIKLGKSVYAIYLDEIMGIGELRTLILNKWICLGETDMSTYCGDCNGWDYSGCDMNRCRNDCDGCGGRRFKCNNTCFNHRHKIAVGICYRGLTGQKELDEGLRILSEVRKPFALIADKLWDNSQSLLVSLLRNCQFVQKYLGEIDIMQEYERQYEQVSRLQKMRYIKGDLVEIKERRGVEFRSYLIPFTDLHVECDCSVFLWLKKNTRLCFNTYDAVSDSLVNKEYKLKDYGNYVQFFNDKKELNKLKVIRLEQTEGDVYECKAE